MKTKEEEEKKTEEEGKEEEPKAETQEATISSSQLEKSLKEFGGKILEEAQAKAQETFERRAKDFRLTETPESEAKAEQAKGQKDVADFLVALNNKDKATLNKMSQERMTREKLHSEGVDADGGYLVPTEFEKGIEKYQNKYGRLRQEFRVMKQKTDRKELNALTGHTTVAIKGELVATTATSKFTFGAPALVPKKYVALSGWSSELGEDNQEISLITELTQDIAREINKAEEVEFIDGTTAGSEGIRQVSGVTTVALGTGDLALGDVTWDDLGDLHKEVYAVAEEDSDQGKYLMSMNQYNLLRQLKASTSGNYFLPAVPSKENPPTAWGHQIVINNRMPIVETDVASSKIIAFGNLKRHCIIGDRTGMRVKLFDAGTVDSGGTPVNLIESDAEVLRVTKRTSFTTVLQDGLGFIVTAAA